MSKSFFIKIKFDCKNNCEMVFENCFSAKETNQQANG